MKDVINVDKAIVNYRIKCDIALSDREELLISQEEYEEAIQFNLSRSKEDIHFLLISKLPEKREYGDDNGKTAMPSEVIGFNKAIDDMHRVIDEMFEVQK